MQSPHFHSSWDVFDDDGTRYAERNELPAGDSIDLRAMEAAGGKYHNSRRGAPQVRSLEKMTLEPKAKSSGGRDI